MSKDLVSTSDSSVMDTDTFDPTVYSFDARPSDELQTAEEYQGRKRRVAVIRTSDRILYKRCRRKWGWQSHLRGNLGSKEGQSPLWLGSGFHYALEDFHGYNRFGHPAEALKAYVAATKKTNPRGLPATWREDAELGIGMLHYYADSWLRNRQPLETYIHNGVPQVEVNFRIHIPFDPIKLAAWGYDEVVYSGTLDRVCVDQHGNLWIVEYKTAKTIQTLHLENDSQVTSYCWAGLHLYDRPIAGVIYQQHRKELPAEPKILATGKLSTDKRQLITFQSFKTSIQRMYGSVERAPIQYIDMLNDLAKGEVVQGDKFVWRSKVERNLHQCEAEGIKILMEVEEMLNPELGLYPNPDRTCQYMCPFNGACVSMDDGGDYEYELSLLFQDRDPVYDHWRKNIKLPDTDPTQFFLT